MTETQTPVPWTAHDYITRAYERTANVDSMIARLHEYGYEIRPIAERAAALREQTRITVERIREQLLNHDVVDVVDHERVIEVLDAFVDNTSGEPR